MVPVLPVVVSKAENVLLLVLVCCPGLVLHPGGDGELLAEVVGEESVGEDHAPGPVELVDGPGLSLPALRQAGDPGVV